MGSCSLTISYSNKKINLSMNTKTNNKEYYIFTEIMWAKKDYQL